LEQLLVTSLQAGVDTSVIVRWLEHAGVRSTDGYLHADITVKEKALAIPAEAQPGRYRLARSCDAGGEGLSEQRWI